MEGKKMKVITLFIYCLFFLCGCATVFNPTEGQLRIMFSPRHLYGAKVFMQTQIPSLSCSLPITTYPDPKSNLEYLIYTDPFGDQERVVRAKYIATCGDVVRSTKTIQFGKNSLGAIQDNGSVFDISIYMYTVR